MNIYLLALIMTLNLWKCKVIDPYKILGVPRSASQDQIKKVWR